MNTGTTALALFLAGSVFFSAFGRVKGGVVADGVEVGGLPYAEAAELVREEISSRLPPFTVHAPHGDERFVTQFTDDVDEILRAAKKGESVTAAYRRVWADAETELSALCARNAVPAKDAVLTFSERGFSYEKEEWGTACDYFALLSDVEKAFRERRDEVTLRTYPVSPAVTEQDLRARTRLLASFTTYFDGTNAPRAHNIFLSAHRISGCVLAPGEEFSFNGRVGKRTRANGFEEAPVIQGGTFVQGVGGGVCQTSTTLMNAALRAGMTVTESRPHSLSVGYVPPSLDAMVSSESDLKFVNPYPVPVYLLAKTGSGQVTFSFYGLPDGRRYETESHVLLRVEPPPEQIVEGEEDAWLRSPKAGIASESYLLVYEGETLLSKTLFRRDTYAVVQGIRQRKCDSQG